MVFLVTYDLNKPGKDYSSLYKTLKSAVTWWHYLDSTWLIETSESSAVWYNKIAPSLDANDHILVIQVTKNYEGWLPKEAWDWIRERVF